MIRAYITMATHLPVDLPLSIIQGMSLLNACLDTFSENFNFLHSLGSGIHVKPTEIRKNLKIFMKVKFNVINYRTSSNL